MRGAIPEDFLRVFEENTQADLTTNHRSAWISQNINKELPLAGHGIGCFLCGWRFDSSTIRSGPGWALRMLTADLDQREHHVALRRGGGSC